MGILDLIFPKRCVNCGKFGAYLCPRCFVFLSFDVEKLCLVCNRPSFNSLTHPKCLTKYTIDGAFASVVFGKSMQKLIYRFKYKPYLSDLASFLSDLFYEGIIQNEEFFKVEKKHAMLVPVPLHPRRLRQRGYNQTAILAKNVGIKLSLPVIDLLVRVKDTKSQVTLKREMRKENMKGAFVTADKALSLSGMTIFLIDDVLTSGATLLEAASVLKKAGAKCVYGLTLAHGQ